MILEQRASLDLMGLVNTIVGRETLEDGRLLVRYRTPGESRVKELTIDGDGIRRLR